MIDRIIMTTEKPDVVTTVANNDIQLGIVRRIDDPPEEEKSEDPDLEHHEGSTAETAKVHFDHAPRVGGDHALLGAGRGLPLPVAITKGDMSLWHFPTTGSPKECGLCPHVPVYRAAMSARRIGPRAVARYPGRCPQGPLHEFAQQRLLQLRAGRSQFCAAGCVVQPVAQPPEGDWAPRLKLPRGMAALAVPHRVLELG